MAERPDPPNPLSDVARGLGLLFRAARNAAKKLPSKEIEEVVVTSAREVGRAFENVASTLEREVLRKKAPPPRGPGDPAKGASTPPADPAPKPREDDKGGPPAG